MAMVVQPLTREGRNSPSNRRRRRMELMARPWVKLPQRTYSRQMRWRKHFSNRPPKTVSRPWPMSQVMEAISDRSPMFPIVGRTPNPPVPSTVIWPKIPNPTPEPSLQQLQEKMMELKLEVTQRMGVRQEQLLATRSETPELMRLKASEMLKHLDMMATRTLLGHQPPPRPEPVTSTLETLASTLETLAPQLTLEQILQITQDLAMGTAAILVTPEGIEVLDPLEILQPPRT
jgi:hypothetical protein